MVEFVGAGTPGSQRVSGFRNNNLKKMNINMKN